MNSPIRPFWNFTHSSQTTVTCLIMFQLCVKLRHNRLVRFCDRSFQLFSTTSSYMWKEPSPDSGVPKVFILEWLTVCESFLASVDRFASCFSMETQFEATKTWFQINLHIYTFSTRAQVKSSRSLALRFGARRGLHRQLASYLMPAVELSAPRAYLIMEHACIAIYLLSRLMCFTTPRNKNLARFHKLLRPK